MQPDDTYEKTALKGYLTIHVAGYKMNQSQLKHVFMNEGKTVCVPDNLIKAEIHPVGSMLWIEEGWAVGDNPRERFCKWHAGKGMLKFLDLDEAVAYIYRLRQKRKLKQEKYTLIYFLKDHHGREYIEPVFSLEDIAKYEKEVDAETARYNESLKAARKATEEEYPALELIAKSFGSSAVGLSMLLKVIRNEGTEKAMQGMSKATYYRQVKKLRELGLLT